MSSLKDGESSARRSIAYLSLLGTTQLHLRNPLIIAAWSVAFPGMGHLLLSKYLRGFVLFIWEVYINYKAHINLLILYSFMFKQVITWLIGLTVVELRLIEYPVRLFQYANKTSFTFEYFVYLSICAIFNVNFPEKKNNLSKFMYYFWYCTVLTAIEIVVERYTNIVKYIHWTWYISWITFFITFYMTRKYTQWFFKGKGN